MLGIKKIVILNFGGMEIKEKSFKEPNLNK